MKAPVSRRVVFLLVFAVGGLAALVLMVRGEGDELTREGLGAARARWRDHGASDYEMEVAITGVQTGRHTISVRNGRVVEMKTGGAAVEPRVWEYWSVEGMFRFLADELRNAEDPQRAHGGSDVVLIVEFDDVHGYPRRFVRHVTGQATGIEWNVEKFSLTES